MTSSAFILGVLPLAVSSGAGAAGRNEIGICVIGGMLSATVLAIFFVPVFFVLIMRNFTKYVPIEEKKKQAEAAAKLRELKKQRDAELQALAAQQAGQSGDNADGNAKS